MARQSKPGKSTTLLFIGNSFTARNDVPGLIAKIAATASHHVEHKLLSIGGASLRTHWNKAEALQQVQTGDYDYVVLQEQSTLPIKNRTRTRENILQFDQAIRATGSTTVLYLTWARKHAPQSQQALTEVYTSVGKEIGATVIPAGVAWERFLKNHDKPVLHDKDGSHPTLAGSFLAACVFGGVLFGDECLQEPVQISGLDSDEVKLLMRTARDTVKSFKDQT